MTADAHIEVLRQGDSSGNEMIVRIDLPSGREIFGFATRNAYGGEWDLGPTWNYVVRSGRPFLVDTGRRGMGPKLLRMMADAGVPVPDLAFVTLSHGHEDHDGGLFEVAQESGAAILAHKTYGSLVQVYPERAPSPEKQGFPASCWDCPMPKSFYEEHCLAYHTQRNTLAIEDLFEFRDDLGEGVSVRHVPGHSPDAVAFVVDGEAMLIGDTILPGITPHPTREAIFAHTKSLLPGEYTDAQQLYGLRAYLRSLGELKAVGREVLVLPAHRLFYKDQWNHMELQARIEELFDHHVARCADMLDIVRGEPKTAEEIAKAHFPPERLKGSGLRMAVNEVLSHCELLEAGGDVLWEDGRVAATGQATGFESMIRALGSFPTTP
jgi:glyoxylase-like metal-dependent hydrolase (beta-lactamase superfamily II)